jgi:hypothetical protein
MKERKNAKSSVSIKILFPVKGVELPLPAAGKNYDVFLGKSK